MPKRGPQPKFNDKEKWCNRCKRWLPLVAFGDNKRTASGKAYYCKPCHSSYCRQFWTSVQAYERMLEREYGITPSEYLAMWNSQAHKCAVCFGDLTLYNRNTCVSVDSVTKRFRALLCANCQTGIEKLQNSARLLLKAAALMGVL